MPLPENLLALLRLASPCHVATLMPDGSPQLTQTWVDTDGEHVPGNTVHDHRGGAEHIEMLSRRYTGQPYPWYGGRDQTGLVMVIAADEVHATG